MAWLVIGLAAWLASMLTLFSGFGLGTLLMPVMAVFFPVPVAVTVTAVVHFLNNLFKLALVGRHAAWSIVWRFGLPAIAAAFAGAYALLRLADTPPLLSYHAWGAERLVTPVNLVIAVLMTGFALAEIGLAAPRLSAHPRYLPLGGVLSGFFGGLSGHQGAFRSAFLARCGLSKESFIGTNAVIASLVDAARLAVYAGHVRHGGLGGHLPLVMVATLAAWLGAWAGARLIRRVTMRAMQWVVAGLLLGIAAGLGAGFL